MCIQVTVINLRHIPIDSEPQQNYRLAIVRYELGCRDSRRFVLLYFGHIVRARNSNMQYIKKAYRRLRECHSKITQPFPSITSNQKKTENHIRSTAFELSMIKSLGDETGLTGSTSSPSASTMVHKKVSCSVRVVNL